MRDTYVDVILPLPLEGLFTYAVPLGMADKVCQGLRVLVPFGKSKHYVGVVAQVHGNKPETYSVKEISQLLDSRPVLLPRQFQLWQWIADYYMSSIGDVYKAAFPSGLKAEDGYKPKTELYVRLAEPFRSPRGVQIAMAMLARADKQREALECYLSLAYPNQEIRQSAATPVTREELMNTAHATLSTISLLVKRGILETFQVEVGRLNHESGAHPENIKPLSSVQREAYSRIQASFQTHSVTLLHGVTSSGKTEIYIHLIQHAIDSGQQVLYLLPEIALTVQMMERLKRVFGSRLGIYHSKYSDAERVEIWQKMLSDQPYDVILGARSAVFLPFQRLGLVIVDEEHETSYKQQDPAPRYHARSVAIVLAQMCHARTLLGTATPSMETYYNAQRGKYALVELTQRYQGMELPEIQVVDIQDLQHRKMMNGPFSPLLLAKVRQALEAGEQAILFQNRRGFAPMIECKQCGWVPHCQNCDVSLTLHRNMNQLTCHYCGYTYQVPAECPACGCKELRTRGYGTEKIEDYIREIFPEVQVARMDLDTTRTRNAYERIIHDFAVGHTRILVGTQMLSKGLDFDRVSVVGILNADTMLNYPDFRAYEHAFTMMSQVSGRAGRKNKRGLVILQTRNPQTPVISQVVHHDFAAFFHEQLEERRAFRYPPYYHLIYVYLKHRHDAVVDTAGLEMGSRLRQWFGDRVLGPDKPAVAKVKTLNIQKIMLKLENGIDMKKVRQYLKAAQQQMSADKRYSALQVYYDVDPD